MSVSVQTNVGAMAALQSLNANTRDLQEVQQRINTGLKIANAKDNGAVYNIAQQMRSEQLSYGAVKAGLDRAKSMADVALAAGEALSDTLMQMRDKAVAAADPSITAAARTAFNNEFTALRDQIGSIIANAVFDGANLLNNTGPFVFQANTSGSQTVTIPNIDLRLPAVAGTLPAPVPPVAMMLGSAEALTSATAAADARDRVAASLEFANSQLARLGASAKRIENHGIFVSKLQDAINAGIGNMVDADLATESARLQSLQVKQQLSTQALSIANQAPQTILSLFRG